MNRTAKITGPNAGGLRQFPIRTSLTARVGQFVRQKSMSLTFSNAVTIAQMELNKIQRFGDSYVLLEERATETPYGWLIPWAQSDFRFTKEVRLGGNLPFFVDIFTGEVCHASVIHQDFEDWLRAYARQHGYFEEAELTVQATATAPVSSMSIRRHNTVVAVASAAASGCA